MTKQIIRLSPRKPGTIEEDVGRRLRFRRLLLNMTQDQLAECCNISAQQIHKYETGASSMNCSRLVQFSAALGVPTQWFFEGIESHPELPDDMLNLLVDRDNQDLLSDFHKISDPAIRKAVLDMVRQFAEREDLDQPAAIDRNISG